MHPGCREDYRIVSILGPSAAGSAQDLVSSFGHSTKRLRAAGQKGPTLTIRRALRHDSQDVRQDVDVT